ncbi:MAG: hypothetical protein K0T00_2522, partial [Gaiellaceae bacterium]|nr:hypothetical protein [Gaiellaceae bacterium]
MARNRASMREGPLAELFRATEAAQRQAEGTEKPPEDAPQPAAPEPELPQERTVEHVPDFIAEEPEQPQPQAAAAAPAVPVEPEIAAPEPPPAVAPEL